MFVRRNYARLRFCHCKRYMVHKLAGCFTFRFCLYLCIDIYILDGRRKKRKQNFCGKLLGDNHFENIDGNVGPTLKDILTKYVYV